MCYHYILQGYTRYIFEDDFFPKKCCQRKRPYLSLPEVAKRADSSPCDTDIFPPCWNNSNGCAVVMLDKDILDAGITICVVASRLSRMYALLELRLISEKPKYCTSYRFSEIKIL